MVSVRGKVSISGHARKGAEAIVARAGSRPGTQRSDLVSHHA